MNFPVKENSVNFEQTGKVSEFWTDWKSPGKSHKSWQSQGISNKCYLLLFAKIDEVFSKKNKRLKILKNGEIGEFCQSEKVGSMCQGYQSI